MENNGLCCKAINKQQKTENTGTIWESTSMYFENNKDLMAAQDFEAALRLGCFDQEFMYFGAAFLNEGKVNYRISAKEINLQLFVEASASLGYYPTPILCYLKRQPAPSGHDDALKLQVKKETAWALKKCYNRHYFAALHVLSSISPNNGSYHLLQQAKDELDGVYDERDLQLFEHMVQVAVDSKVLSEANDRAFTQWIKESRKQMADEIRPKANYKKTLAGFAYEDQQGDLRYFYDAKKEVAYKEKAKYDRMGVFATPVVVKEMWLKEMGEFLVARQEFVREMKECFAGGYLDLLREIKALPSAIPVVLFQEQCKTVEDKCMEEAYRTFLSYGYRWNISKGRDRNVSQGC